MILGYTDGQVKSPSLRRIEAEPVGLLLHRHAVYNFGIRTLVLLWLWRSFQTGRKTNMRQATTNLASTAPS